MAKFGTISSPSVKGNNQTFKSLLSKLEALQKKYLKNSLAPGSFGKRLNLGIGAEESDHNIWCSITVVAKVFLLYPQSNILQGAVGVKKRELLHEGEADYFGA